MRVSRTEMMSFLELPEPAREPAMRLILKLQGQNRETLMDLLAAVRRDRQRYESDSTTDPERRVLVGPRLPRRMVDRYRVAAKEKGQSLYRWATEALEEHLANQDRGRADNGTE